MKVALPDDLDAAFSEAGAVAWGGVPFAVLAQQMCQTSRVRVEELLPNPTVVFVAAFPYFTGERAGNVSVYARGADYHTVIGRRLDTICSFLREKYKSYLFFPAVDCSPLPEREAAWLAGLGVQGRNGLLILPPYGSYVFLGTILTDAPLEVASTAPADACIGCGRCVSACPSGALRERRMERCLSELTQRKGGLTPEETALVKAHPYVWGCDICQNVCPYNQAPKVAALPEWEGEALAFLTEDMLEGLSNKTFRERFGDKAFAWRGPAVLKRNFALKKEESGV